VYGDLLRQYSRLTKTSYVLASPFALLHGRDLQHRLLEDHGGTLPGWIHRDGRRGRYSLPADAKNARAARDQRVRYLLATVAADRHVTFEFRRVSERTCLRSVMEKFTPEFVCTGPSRRTVTPPPRPAMTHQQASPVNSSAPSSAFRVRCRPMAGDAVALGLAPPRQTCYRIQ